MKIKKILKLMSLSIVILHFLIAIFGGAIIPYPINRQFSQSVEMGKILDRYKRNVQKKNINELHILGLDEQNRDVFSRLIIATRTDFLIGFFVVIFSFIIGLPLGYIAGYYNNWRNIIIKFYVEIFAAIPTLFLMLLLSYSYSGANYKYILIFTISIYGSTRVIKILEKKVSILKNEPFVLIAKNLGKSDFYIISRHIIPYTISTIGFITFSNFRLAIFTETSLSFLGYGLPDNTPSWGNMLISGANLFHTAPNLIYTVGFTMTFFILGYFLTGNIFKTSEV